MADETRWMATVAAPTGSGGQTTTPAARLAGSSRFAAVARAAANARPAVAAAVPAAVTAPVPAEPERATPAASLPPKPEAQSSGRSLRAAAIRARTWQAAMWLALRHPSVATFEGLAANPSATLERGLRWCLAGVGLGLLLPAAMSFLHGGAPLLLIGRLYLGLMVISVVALAGGIAAAYALAAHLAAYGLAMRPHLLERQAPASAAAPGGLTPGTFQKAIYTRLMFACAAFAAPLGLTLGVALIAPGLLRGLLLLALSGYAAVMLALAVRAACRVSWRWAALAAAAGVLVMLLPLAVVAGAWVGLVG